MADSVAPGRTRLVSMSSTRRTTRPPADRAASQAMRKVRAWPTWSPPVGEGARRPVGGDVGIIVARMGKPFAWWREPFSGLIVLYQEGHALRPDDRTRRDGRA